MSSNGQVSGKPHLIWVSTISPSQSLDSATWLDTTADLRQLGWKVSLIGKGAAEQHRVRGVETILVPHPPLYFFGQWVFHLGVWLHLAREWQNADIVMFHQISAIWLLPLVILRWFSRRNNPLLLMDTRDLPDYSSGGLKLFLRRKYYDLVYWLVERLADGQTAITSRMAQLVKVPPKQLWGLWPSGVDLSRFAPAQTARYWPGEEEPIQLTYIGRLITDRNLLPLCQAVQRANQLGMSFKLHLYGSGNEWERLTTFSLSAEGYIRVCSPVPHQEIPEILAQTHVGVTSLPHPTEEKYQASSPVKLFEYMAAGLPILSTSSACHTEVVGSGDYAFWVDSVDEEELLDALRGIWYRHAGLSQLGEEAAAAARNWTWEAAARQLSQALLFGLKQHNLTMISGDDSVHT